MGLSALSLRFMAADRTAAAAAAAVYFLTADRGMILNEKKKLDNFTKN